MKCRLPRTRGDGPAQVWAKSVSARAPPHTRGWTRFEPGAGFLACGSPAHAGMDPYRPQHPVRDLWLPRTRGDGPTALRVVPNFNAAPPHTRGWTPPMEGQQGRRGGSPAHAGMDPVDPLHGVLPNWLPRTRGDGPDHGRVGGRRSWAPPHTRGWTAAMWKAFSASTGSPAHAGMDPPVSGRDFDADWLPRTRGDGPYYSA